MIGDEEGGGGYTDELQMHESLVVRRKEAKRGERGARAARREREKRKRKGMQNNSGSEIQKLTRPLKNYLMLNFPMSLNSSTPIFPD